MTTQAGPVSDPAVDELYLGMIASRLDDPYPGYRRLREEAPILRASDGSLVLSRFAECDAALRHRAFGKGDEQLGFGRPELGEEARRARDRFGRTMLVTNPPEHTRLRRAVSSAFTNRHVEELRPVIARRADALLAELAERPGADFVEDLALPLPVTVISDLLGVPEDTRPEFTAKIRRMFALMEPSEGEEGFRRAMADREEVGEYFGVLLDAKAARPADDLLSRLATAPEDERLSRDEMISTALLLFAAGFITTTNLLGNAVHALFARPDQEAMLRADPALIPSAVEEFLRFDSPVQIDLRSVLEETEFAGARLRPGEVVVTVIGAANHDPEVAERPDALNVRREAPIHLSFASGVHFCLGAHLARVEAQVVLARLYGAEYPALEPAGDAVRAPGLGLRGFARLPVALSRA
ncbi:cytochrome P450 [Actinocorallia sp. API 0066]|uniref:cytochrome P450 n=1 Tax=Actinocorallia sp. API 0066 TaxID=2896846 RepID=UPI001E40C2CD|nr:cytochrome P450 [Actinocorallia sp. API 0066]MCD0450182.1 cytochrome P450 [Actinocorallia sp. API 0066]